MNVRDLEGLGLSDRGAKIYLALLEIGQATALEISEKIKVPKSTVHDTLKYLSGMGLATHYSRKNRIIFTPGNPDVLAERIEKTEKTFNRILPELKLLYVGDRKRPRVRFYETKEGIEAAITEMVAETKEILFISHLSSANTALPEFFPKAAQERIKHEIRARVLASGEVDIEKFKIRDQEMLRETRALDGKMSFKSDLWLWSGKAFFFETTGQSVLSIEDENMVGLLISLFEMLWRSSEA
jgi:HTH-type transcriptional regulator, sugar sensing transcriptional regulator